MGALGLSALAHCSLLALPQNELRKGGVSGGEATSDGGNKRITSERGK